MEAKQAQVILDAGHGGSDPGKIGLNNLLEKDINLAITEKVKKCLEKEKITAELTRKEDKGLGITGDGSKKDRRYAGKSEDDQRDETCPYSEYPSEQL